MAEDPKKDEVKRKVDPKPWEVTLRILFAALFVSAIMSVVLGGSFFTDVLPSEKELQNFRFTLPLVVALAAVVWSGAVLLYLLFPNGPIKTEEISRASYTTFIGVVTGAFAAASYSVLSQNGPTIDKLFDTQKDLIANLNASVEKQTEMANALQVTLTEVKAIDDSLNEAAHAVTKSAQAAADTARLLKDFAASDARTANALASMNRQLCRQALYAAIEAKEGRRQLAALTDKQDLSATVARQEFETRLDLEQRDILDRIANFVVGRAPLHPAPSTSGAVDPKPGAQSAAGTGPVGAALLSACDDPAELDALLGGLADSHG